MPKPKKAHRGKHRWVGLMANSAMSGKHLKSLFSKFYDDVEIRVYDVQTSSDRTYFIAKVPLSHYRPFLEKINQLPGYSSITSSGKIRLVRFRLMEENSPSNQ